MKMTDKEFRQVYRQVETFILTNGIRFVDDLDYDVTRGLESLGIKPKAKLVSLIVDNLYHNQSEVLAEVEA